jgi:uncharacterized surface protein with fasciclin (FAS1) repeats
MCMQNAHSLNNTLMAFTMFTKNKLVAGIVLLFMAFVSSCTNKWDEYTETENAYADGNLFQQIAKDTSLSKFASYLKQTGYSDTISLTKSFTVWAPTNEALKAVDQALSNDATKLKAFVAHHIARLSYYTSDVKAAPMRLAMLDGKYVSFSSGAFDLAPIKASDKVATNGVIHTIQEAAAPISNIWDVVDSLQNAGNMMASYIKLQEYTSYDMSKAILKGYDSLTGNPIYDLTNARISLNLVTDSVYDIKDEAKEYTIFILNNAAWDADSARLAPFYKTGTQDSTSNLVHWNTAKDLVIEGAYAPNELPDFITSKFGVKVPVNKSAILSSRRTSNGWVYVMSEMNFQLKDKLPDLIIQGEQPYNISHSMPAGILMARTLVNPNTGLQFKDLFVYGHQTNQFNVGYRVKNVYTTKYKVYWVAVNNNRFTNPFKQRLAISSATNATFPYVTINPNVYDEVYLGEYEVTNYGSGNLMLYLVSDNVTISSTNQNTNSLFLDYIRMEPIIQ